MGAFGVVAVLFRWTRAIAFLHRWLPLVWPAGVSLSLLENMQITNYWSGDGCAVRRGSVIYVGLVATCFPFCLACYVAAAVGVFRTTQAVQLKIWSRVQIFTLVTLLSVASFWLSYFGWSWLHHFPFQLTANVLYNLKGFFDAVAYSCQKSLQLVDSDRRILNEVAKSHEASLHVGFCDVLNEEILISDCASELSEPPRGLPVACPYWDLSPSQEEAVQSA